MTPALAELTPGVRVLARMPAPLAASADDPGPVLEGVVVAPPFERTASIASGCAGYRATYRLVLVRLDAEDEPREVAVERVSVPGRPAGRRRGRAPRTTPSERQAGSQGRAGARTEAA